MTDDCRHLVDAYVEWLRHGFEATSVGGACELTTPFLDRHNDHIQIYATHDSGKYVLTDDGYTIADLQSSGMELTSPKRRAALESILAGLGIKLVNGALTTEAARQSLGQRLHFLVQAMLAVNDMFVLAKPRVAAFFWDDVRQFFDENDVRYSPHVKVAGKSGFDHAIDFLIPRSRDRPERLVQAINSPRRSTIGTYLFALSDTREARGTGSEAYAFLNDSHAEVGGDVIEALESYEVTPALWSRRAGFVETLRR